MRGHTQSNLRVIGHIAVITILVSIAFSFYYGTNPLLELIHLPQSLIATRMMMERPAPEIRGIAAWLNTPGEKPLTLEKFKGQVVLVDFWTYSCINCQHSVPYVVEWYKKYHDQGLVVIGVHTPEFKFEQKKENVITAIAQYGIEYPVAMDNSYSTWRAYNNLYWPAEYLIDKKGNIVYRHYGEGEYDVTEAKIQALLRSPSQ